MSNKSIDKYSGLLPSDELSMDIIEQGYKDNKINQNPNKIDSAPNLNQENEQKTELQTYKRVRSFKKKSKPLALIDEVNPQNASINEEVLERFKGIDDFDEDSSKKKSKEERLAEEQQEHIVNDMFKLRNPFYKITSRVSGEGVPYGRLSRRLSKGKLNFGRTSARKLSDPFNRDEDKDYFDNNNAADIAENKDDDLHLKIIEEDNLPRKRRKSSGDDENGLAYEKPVERESIIDGMRLSMSSYYSNDYENNDNIQINIFDSIVMIIIQIINVIIKYSLVQIAFCIKTLGIFYGTLTICIIAILSLVSVNLLMACYKLTKKTSYVDYAEKLMGPSGKYIMSILLFLTDYGDSISYVIIFLKGFPNIITINLGKSFIANQIFLSVILGLILLFYSYRQDLSGIKKAAYYGFIGILMFIIITIIDFLYSIYIEKNVIMEDITILPKKQNIGFNKRMQDVIAAISCLILSFSYHTFTFSIYDSMGSANINYFYSLVSLSVFISTVIYLLCGTIGYFLYNEGLVDSILDVIGNKLLNTLLTFSNLLNVIMTFPITFISVKCSFMFLVEAIFTKIRNFFYYVLCRPCKLKKKIVYNYNYEEDQKDKKENQKQVEIKNEDKKDENNTFNKEGFRSSNLMEYNDDDTVKIHPIIEFFITVILFGSIFTIANLVPSLKIWCSLLGGFTCNAFTFIFPALFYIKFSRHKLWHKKNIIPIVFIVVGVAALIVCVASTIISL